VGGEGCVGGVGNATGRETDPAARTLALLGTKLWTYSEGALHSSHSSLSSQLPRRLWSFVSIAHIQQFTRLRKIRDHRVGLVRSCPAGSCHAFQSPYLPATWVCTLTPAAARHKSWNKAIDLIGSSYSHLPHFSDALYPCWTEVDACDCAAHCASC
jgi:hypothetical protein